jgi:hypothetical protein
VGTAELARELLESGQQVAISVAFGDAEAIAAALEPSSAACARIHGRLGAAARRSACAFSKA